MDKEISIDGDCVYYKKNTSYPSGLFYLPHQCDNWEIGTLEEAKEFAKDLNEVIKKVEAEQARIK